MMDGQLGLERLGGLSIALVCLAFVFSCANGSTVSPSSRTQFIRIREQVSPQDLYVYVGDEVRWQNLRPDPVKVGLLSPGPPELHHFITWTDVLHSASNVLHRHVGRSLLCIFSDPEYAPSAVLYVADPGIRRELFIEIRRS